MVQMRSALGGIPVSRAMITDFRALAPDEPLSLAVDHVLAGFQQDFPVLESGRLVGVLIRADMLKGLTQHGPHTLVGNVMQRQFETAGPFEMLESAFARLQTRGCRSLPVLRGGRLVGVVTMDNVSELLMVQEALRSGRP